MTHANENHPVKLHPLVRWLAAGRPAGVLCLETPFSATLDDLAEPSNTSEQNNLEAICGALNGLHHNWVHSDRKLLPCGHRPSNQDEGFLDLVFYDPQSAFDFMDRAPCVFCYTSTRGDERRHNIGVRSSLAVVESFGWWRIQK
jgi:hypothetical protein